MTSAKEYYSCYQADGIVHPLNRKLAEIIMYYRPASVLEFGCGIGKNLGLLRESVPELFGIDISPHNVKFAESQGFNVLQGDESRLNGIRKFDIIFTCSTLDHIEHVDRIVSDMKRQANLAVILAETTDQPPAPFYYPHDYRALGFTKIRYAWKSPMDGCTYHLWIWEADRIAPKGDALVEAEIDRYL